MAPPKPGQGHLAAGTSAATLVEAKQASGASVAVCLPALDEARTIGAICREVAALRSAGLVDQLLVVDSGSSDATKEHALAAGADVADAAALVPAHPRRHGGKGDTMWRSLSVVTGDIVVWLDSDVRNFSSHFVTRLIAPLLSNEEIKMTKAFYRRPLDTTNGVAPEDGGRVTEIAVRPLLQMFAPELAAFRQPLAGEVAIRKEVALGLCFFSGYAVDLGLLLDVVLSHGPASVQQVDLGLREHRNQSTQALGRMSFEIMSALFLRLDEMGRVKLPDDLPNELTQFAADGAPRSVRLPVVQLPPMREVLARLR